MRSRAERVELWGGALLASLGLLTGCEDASTAKPCADPEPLVVGGQEVGIEVCEGGAWRHRPNAAECPNLLPRTDYQCGGAGGGGPDNDCSSDADCGAKESCSGGDFEGGCYCRAGCTSDADCGAGQLCECGDPIGRCVSSSCTTDADCDEGLLCATYVTEPGCGSTAYACQTTADTCASDADCGSGAQCTLRQGARECAPIECAIGRPFLVEGSARLSPVATRADWSERGVTPDLSETDAVSRALLAGYFTDIGRMEHASIAAFGRFLLELLSLGAPPDLIVRTQQAIADETRHARLAFALASAYRGRDVGPGPLSIDRALMGSDDPHEVLRRVIREGCVGETIASMEAREALAAVKDPTLRFVFSEIARDEADHALLAWRAAQFLLERGGESARSVIVQEIALLREELRQAPVRPGEVDETLLALGYVSDSVRADLRREALERAVIGGLVSLIEGPPSSAMSRVTAVG